MSTPSPTPHQEEPLDFIPTSTVMDVISLFHLILLMFFGFVNLLLIPFEVGRSALFDKQQLFQYESMKTV